MVDGQFGESTEERPGPVALSIKGIAGTEGTLAVTVLSPATLEVKIVTRVPLESVHPESGTNAWPLPVADRATSTPVTGLARASWTTTVRAIASLPSAVTSEGKATSVELDGEGMVPGTSQVAVVPS